MCLCFKYFSSWTSSIFADSIKWELVHQRSLCGCKFTKAIYNIHTINRTVIQHAMCSLQGHKEVDKFIVTQLPLQHTVADFWGMVRDYGSNSVVMMLTKEQHKIGR